MKLLSHAAERYLYELNQRAWAWYIATKYNQSKLEQIKAIMSEEDKNDIAKAYRWKR